MKRFLLALSILAVTTGAAIASSRSYSNTLVNEAGLAYNNTYPLDVSSLKSVSMAAVYSTDTFSVASFTDGAPSTGSITVLSTASIHGVVGTNTLTIVSGKNSALAAAAGTDTVSVASNTVAALNGSYITLNGTIIKFGRDFFIGTSSNTTATSLSNAVNAMTPFTSTVSGSTVTISCNVAGVACNAYTLTSSAPTYLIVGKAKFTGGQDAVSFTLNGFKLKNGIDWSTGLSSTNTATSIVTAASSISGFTASASSNVVTISCTSSGTVCNSYTLTSSSAAALLAGAGTFSGGVNPVRMAINGTVLTEGVDFNAITSSAVAAVNLSNAINANSTLAPLITASTGPIGVVTLTSDSVGAGTKYSLWSSNYNGLRPFATAMYGGSSGAVVTTANELHLPAHGFTRALPVLYTKTAGTSPGTLVAGTTYFVVPVDANNIQLAASSANAVAGSPVVGISTQAAAGAGSFKLTPLAYTGTAGFFWEASNDGSNYNPVSVSSVTYSSPSSTPTSTLWDLGDINFKWLRLNATAPTTGALNLVVTVNGRSAGNQNRP